MSEELDIDALLGPELVIPETAKKSSIPKAPSAPRELKGVMVRFRNQKGEIITGLGVKYYVVRFEGKLHYKEASQVTFIDELAS